MNKESIIFVAGHRGVAGSAICKELESQGYQNIIVKRHNELDLKDQSAVNNFFNVMKPEYVFLCAAKVGGIAEKASCPAEFIMDNLQIEVNVIAAAHETKVKRLLFMGSSFCYPLNADMPVKEEALCTGSHGQKDEPYIVAKIAGIKLCEYYFRQYQDAFFSVMPCAFYGPGDSFDLSKATVIPSMMRRMKEAKDSGQKEFYLWGTGLPEREFLYSSDIANACIFLMNQSYEIGGKFYNLGNGSKDISIIELARIIKCIVGYSGKILLDTTKPDGMMKMTLDSSKLLSMGWKPQVDLSEGIQKLYLHYLNDIEH